jgi:hypothetical protein
MFKVKRFLKLPSFPTFLKFSFSHFSTFAKGNLLKIGEELHELFPNTFNFLVEIGATLETSICDNILTISPEQIKQNKAEIKLVTPFVCRTDNSKMVFLVKYQGKNYSCTRAVYEYFAEALAN